jgi:uncharacterized protein with PIN domain
MARFYSNENFPIDIVRQLRQMGQDVLTSYEAGQANQRISDAAVLSFATQDDRIVITLNREDFIQLHRSGTEHRGIIICKDDRDYESQSQAVQNLLAENPLTSVIACFMSKSKTSLGQVHPYLFIKSTLGNLKK